MIEGKILIIDAIIIISLVGLYIYEEMLPPEKTSIGNLGRHLGKYVIIKGVVLRNPSSNFFIVSDMQFKNKVGVYDSYSSPNSGAVVSVAGVVKKFKDRYEIVIQKAGDLKIIKDCYETTIPVVMNNPSKFNGLNISVSGKIEYTRIVSLTIYDGSGTMKIECKGGYSGSHHAYFLVKYVNGEFLAEAAYPNPPGKIVKISSIQPRNNRTYLINGTIETYGIYGIIRMDSYHMRFTVESQNVPTGLATITGQFVYDTKYGEYILHAGNVK